MKSFAIGNKLGGKFETGVTSVVNGVTVKALCNSHLAIGNKGKWLL